MTRLRLGLLLLPLLASCRREEPVPPPTPQEQDRRELTRSPKLEWKPGAAGGLTILLLTDKAKIRAGEPFRYRLEMRNAGREPLAFRETAPSFIKDGSLCGDTAFRFLATPPRGAERVLKCRPLPPGAPAGGDLDLSLAPGDYLLTRGGFRSLAAAFDFAAPGTYRLQAVHAPAGGPRAVSNAVLLEVVP